VYTRGEATRTRGFSEKEIELFVHKFMLLHAKYFPLISPLFFHTFISDAAFFCNKREREREREKQKSNKIL